MRKQISGLVQLSVALSLVVALVLISACSSSTKSQPAASSAPSGTVASAPRVGVGSGAGSMSASINGVGWTSVATTASYDNGALKVAGADNARPPLALGLAVVANKPGTYYLPQQNPVVNANLINGAAVFCPPRQNEFGNSPHRIAKGKIAEVWTYSDTYSMMTQLGVIPAPKK